MTRANDVSYHRVTADDQSPESIVYHFRAYCLYLIGLILFLDKTGNLVHIKWLAILEKEPIENVVRCNAVQRSLSTFS